MPRLVTTFLYALVGLLVLIATEISATGVLSHGYTFLVTRPMEAGVTWLVIVAGSLLLDAIIGRRFIGSAILALIILTLGFVSYQKRQFLSEPLVPWDLGLAGQMLDLMPELVRSQPLTAAGLMVGLVAAILLVAVLFRFSMKRLRPMTIGGRLAGIAFGALVLAPFAYGVQERGNQTFRDYLGIKYYIMPQELNYARNGFTLAFAMNVSQSRPSKPDNYSEERLRSTAERYSKRPDATFLGERPNVVMIMSEAFWDPTRMPKVSFDEDPIPFVHSIGSGAVMSPVIGGGTANVEFEALTGFTNAFYQQGSYPYQQYIQRKTPALPWYFRSLGYEAIAVHPYQPSFWNRDAVYTYFGFQKFVTLKEFRAQGATSLGPYVSDEAVTDHILATLKPDIPTFLFAVTMQNHTPFMRNRYGVNQVQPKGLPDEEETAALSSYTQGIIYSDRALKRLVDGLKAVERPTLLVFFGDHAPALRMDVAGHGGLLGPGALTFPEQMIRRRQTPLVVWSNKTGPVRDVGLVSPSLIPNIVLEQIQAHHPFYGDFLGAVRQQFRVIDQAAFVTSDMKITGTAPQDLKDLLGEYQNIQYDQMSGSRYSQETLFCEVKNLACRSSAQHVAAPNG